DVENPSVLQRDEAADGGDADERQHRELGAPAPARQRGGGVRVRLVRAHDAAETQTNVIDDAQLKHGSSRGKLDADASPEPSRSLICKVFATAGAPARRGRRQP